jgi:hypothetical protein
MEGMGAMGVKGYLGAGFCIQGQIGVFGVLRYLLNVL